jgi:hypothetical protein
MEKYGQRGEKRMELDYKIMFYINRKTTPILGVVFPLNRCVKIKLFF